MALGDILKKTKESTTTQLKRTGRALDPSSNMTAGERLGTVAETGQRATAALATGGASEVAIAHKDELGELAAGALSGVGEPQKREKDDPVFSRTTEEEAQGIRDSYGRQAGATQQAYEDAQGQMKTRGGQSSALGQALVDRVGQAYQGATFDPAQAAQIGAVAPRGTTQLDTSGIGRVDFGSLPQAQGYTPGEGRQMLSSLGQQLMQQAQGQGPSVAAEQFKRANEANLAASMAQQASLRGGFDPAAARQIRQSAADLQAQSARDAAMARMQEQLNAQQAAAQVGQAIEQTGQAAGQQSIQAAAQATDQARAELTQRGQDIEMANINASFDDLAKRDQFQADLEVSMKQADLDQVANSDNFNAAVQMAMAEASAKTGALTTAYAGDQQAMMADVNDFNEMVRDAMRQNLSINDAREAFERQLIAEGKEERVAQIMADNAHRTAMLAYSQAVKDRQAKVAQGVFGIGTNLALTTMGMPPVAGGAPTPAPAYNYGGGVTSNVPMNPATGAPTPAYNPAPFNPNPTTQYFPEQQPYQGPMRNQ